MSKEHSKKHHSGPLEGRGKGGKICGLAATGNLKKMRKKARGAAYICGRCGYVSVDKGDLCKPSPL